MTGPFFDNDDYLPPEDREDEEESQPMVPEAEWSPDLGEEGGISGPSGGPQIPDIPEYEIDKVILIGIQNSLIIEIEYTAMSTLETNWYTVEPYSIGPHGNNPGGYFWGYDIDMQTIKSFFLSNISRAKLTEHIFIPRY
jgi:hypothetical protein